MRYPARPAISAILDYCMLVQKKTRGQMDVEPGAVIGLVRVKEFYCPFAGNSETKPGGWGANRFESFEKGRRLANGSVSDIACSAPNHTRFSARRSDLSIVEKRVIGLLNFDGSADMDTTKTHLHDISCLNNKHEYAYTFFTQVHCLIPFVTLLYQRYHFFLRGCCWRRATPSHR